jgi:hypothetical protein
MMQIVEVRFAHGLVHLAPCDVRFDSGFHHDKLIAWRTTCVLARAHDKRAKMGDTSFAPHDSVFV